MHREKRGRADVDRREAAVALCTCVCEPDWVLKGRREGDDGVEEPMDHQ